MKSINAKEFKELIKKNPSWAKSLTEPVEIRTYVNMDNSTITHLSPLLRFKGRDQNGNVASFKGCTKLEVAEGTFDGFVDFGVNYDEIELNLQTQGGNQDTIEIFEDALQNNPMPNLPDTIKKIKSEELDKEEELIDLPYACPVGIKEIGTLNILRPNSKGDAVDFTGCINLKTYRGNYPGHVDIGHNDLLRWLRETSGGPEREKIIIKDLVITGENNKGLACTIHNSLISKLKGKYSSAVRLVGTEIGMFGSVNNIKEEEAELLIKPNLAGTKIELKNNALPSTINVVGFAQNFPFEAYELDIPRQTSKKDGDPLTELRDMLKIKKAMFSKENPRNYQDPWHKQIKRYTVRTIAQCLQADDILKQEGHKPHSTKRLSKILKTSVLIATIIGSFGLNTLIEIGKEIKENTLIEPSASHMQNFVSSRVNKELLKKFDRVETDKIGEQQSNGNGSGNGNGNLSEQPSNYYETDPLEIIISNLESQTGGGVLKLTNSQQTSCKTPADHCCDQPLPHQLKKKKSRNAINNLDNSMSLASL